MKQNYFILQLSPKMRYQRLTAAGFGIGKIRIIAVTIFTRGPIVNQRHRRTVPQWADINLLIIRA